MGISNDAQREVDEFGAASAELKMFPWDSGYIRWEADSRYALEERIGSLEQEVYGLRKRNAELEAERDEARAMVERLIEAGSVLIETFQNYPDFEEYPEVGKWDTLVDERKEMQK